MPFTVTFTDDPARVLDVAGRFLATDPVRNFTMLTLLHERVDRPQPGRYWVASRDGEAVGVVFQSPLDFPTVLITGMEPYAVTAVTGAIAESGVSLPGIGGPAEAVASFIGRWTELSDVISNEVGRQLIYEATEFANGQGSHVTSASGSRRSSSVSGQLRQAGIDDRDLLIEWMRDFHADHPHADPVKMVDTRLPAGRFWIWDDGGPVSAACQSEPLEGVVSIQAVYTPSELRNRGYATACVSALTGQLLANGLRPMLYTNHANQTSNSIYQRIGYRVAEVTVRNGFEE